MTPMTCQIAGASLSVACTLYVPAGSPSTRKWRVLAGRSMLTKSLGGGRTYTGSLRAIISGTAGKSGSKPSSLKSYEPDGNVGGSGNGSVPAAIGVNSPG